MFFSSKCSIFAPECSNLISVYKVFFNFSLKSVNPVSLNSGLQVGALVAGWLGQFDIIDSPENMNFLLQAEA